MFNGSNYLIPMRLYLALTLFLYCAASGFTQEGNKITPIDRTGHLFFYWGWNWDAYSKSNITFEGNSYQFTLDHVAALDKPKAFSLSNYFNPTVATIPQYNFRIGYFFSPHYAITLGTDHMKYVMTREQIVNISGYISDSGTDYDGTYMNDEIIVAGDFLKFEHTDGLNYINTDLRRFDQLFDRQSVNINLVTGVGAGILVPRTNTTLLSMDRYDEFHLSGFGISGMAGINVTFFKHFFLQSEFKTGYINMPDIRTTASESDKASQDFIFYQLNFVFGATLYLKHEKPEGESPKE